MSDTIGKRFLTIVTNPAAAMAEVKENPRWVIAALAVAVMLGLYSAATLQITGPEQLDVMRETRFGQMIPEEDMAEMYAKYEAPTVGARVLQGAQSGIGAALMLFVMVLIYQLFCKLAGGQGNLRQTAGVVYWSSVVSLGLGSLIKWPLVLAKGSSMGVAIGPAIFVVDRGPTDALYQLLSIFDLFTVWGVLLMVIGLGLVHEFVRNKATTVVVTTWLFLSLVLFGIGRLFL